MDRVSFMILFVGIFGIFMHSAAAQNVYVVGDGLGWEIPPNTSVSYTNWASSKTFRVGDILVFNFLTNQQDVVRVPRASYDACTQDNAIGNIITTGPANITLDSTGDHYYICTFVRHCQSGQKLSIRVGSSGSPPGGANPPVTTPTLSTLTTPSPDDEPEDSPPTPSPTNPKKAMTPPPLKAMTPPPLKAMTPPLPPLSASTSLGGSFLLVILSAGANLIF